MHADTGISGYWSNYAQAVQFSLAVYCHTPVSEHLPCCIKVPVRLVTHELLRLVSTKKALRLNKSFLHTCFSLQLATGCSQVYLCLADPHKTPWLCRVNCLLQGRGARGRCGISLPTQSDQHWPAQDQVVSLAVPLDQLLQLRNHSGPCLHHSSHVLPWRNRVWHHLTGEAHLWASDPITICNQ